MPKPKRARILRRNQNAPSNTDSKSKTNQSHGADTRKKHRKMSSFAKLSTKNNYNSANANKEHNAPAQKQKHQQKQHRRPIVPFRRKDRILLIGEGDFSFSHSLVTHHRCKNLVATCYDSKETLYDKYPQAGKNIEDITGHYSPRKTRSKSKSESESQSQFKDAETKSQKASPKVLFSVDAKKLGSNTGGGKDVRFGFPRKERERPAWKKKDEKKDKDKEKDKGGPWDMICFNFPHVGGLSTDVNRQVRANQELLVAFFKASVPLLSGRPDEVDEEDGWGSDPDSEDGSDEDEAAGEGDGDDDELAKAKDERRTEPGQILVTLFEGEPYTLWNIRDLARHAGLKVVTSFKFPWGCYRGYSHARTLGEIEGKDGGRGGWRGEDREARMYVFEKKTDEQTATGAVGTRRKRQADTDDSDSD